MGATDGSGTLRQTLEDLARSQESITAAGLEDLCARAPVLSAAGRAVMLAAVQMVSNLDETAAPWGRVSWEMALDGLGRQGRFLDTMRRFPFAADTSAAARARTAENLAAAQESLRHVRREDLAGDAALESLHVWVLASFRFCTRAAVSPAPGSPSPEAAPPAAVASARLGTSASAGAALVPRCGPGRLGPRMALTARAGPRQRNGIASPRSGIASPRSGIASPRSGIASPRTKVHTLTKAGGYPLASSARGHGASAGALTLAAAARTDAPNLRLQVHTCQMQLEELKREAKNLKGLESQLKWDMHREERQEDETARRNDQQELMRWRQEQAQLASDNDAARLRETRRAELKESREYQEARRANKQAVIGRERQHATEAYLAGKDISESQVRLRKARLKAEAEDKVRANREKLEVVAEQALRARQSEEAETRAAREEEKQRALARGVAEAVNAKEEALRNLEFTQSKKILPLGKQLHIPSRRP